MNLCANARDAMEGMGRDGIIDVALRDIPEPGDAGDATLPAGLVPGDYVRLTVADKGCGMDEKIREHLFEPFFTTKAPGKGTGLGLAVVHGIVTSYGGAVTVSSAPDRGTTIAVYLPKLLPVTESSEH